MSHRALTTKGEIREHLELFKVADRRDQDHHFLADHDQRETPGMSLISARHDQLHALDILAPEPFRHEREFDGLADEEQAAHLHEHGFLNSEEVTRWHRDFRFRIHDQTHGVVPVSQRPSLIYEEGMAIDNNDIQVSGNGVVRCGSEVKTWDERVIRCEKAAGHPKRHAFRIKWEDEDVVTDGPPTYTPLEMQDAVLLADIAAQNAQIPLPDNAVSYLLYRLDKSGYVLCRRDPL